LTVTAHEGANTATASEILVVTATAGPAEAPTIATTDTTMTAGQTSAAMTISVTHNDTDDTLGLVTISGVPSGFGFNKGTDQGSGAWTEAVTDLPSLAIIAPSTDSATLVTLGVTASASENSQSSASATTVNVDIVPCYCRGTLILTADGEVPVEALAIGDRVVTLSGDEQRVRWIGQRAYDGRFIAKSPGVLPICVAAGALADGVPVRDLWLSPEHSLYIDGFLVQAKHLLNSMTISQADSVDAVEYFHIEIDDHDVIVADGAPAETYVDCDNRMMFANAAEYDGRCRDDERPSWSFCAPRLDWEDPELGEIRARLLERAAAAGGREEGDPDLHLVVDGQVIPPQHLGTSAYRFAIPAGSGAVWLASRSIVPAELDAGSRDIRRLGVAVERLVLCDGDLSVEAWHGHQGLSDGFHADEAGHRWTNGLARLPEALLRPFPGAVTLEVHLMPNELAYANPAALPGASA
jgi:hypothetical protein